MKVRELIDELKGVDPNFYVVVQAGDYEYAQDVTWRGTCHCEKGTHDFHEDEDDKQPPNCFILIGY